ncbi:MAG: PLP-dependent aminotransferase family protein [Kofleriaceae bacterium]|nr:PLP-dependent aminotransferase family protein [Kofleriaceae bacterium]
MWSIPRHVSRPSATGGALYARIAEAIVNDIRRGVLRAGDRLPSTRELAAQLAVNRNTIVAAFDDLVAQGWIAAGGARGTRVLADLPAPTPLDAVAAPASTDTRAPTFPLREVASVTTPFGATEVDFHVSIGVPDTRLVPHELLARAYRRALHGRAARTNLDYGSPLGTTRLRTAIAAYLRGRGVSAGIDNVMITRGSQMAIDLAARAVLRPGDTAAVEELGYRPAWRALEEAGARLAGVPVDGAGLVVDKLPARARCLYTTPHHQYPTTVLMSPARRLALLARARKFGIAIIEDDYDHEFHFEGRPVPPLAAMDPTNVIYVGSLSKILAPGLRLGFVAAHPSVIETLARLRATIDRQGDHVLETTIAELIEDGDLARHVRKMRRVYHARRDALAAVLVRELGNEVLSFELPAGGMSLWARAAPDIDLERWRQRALERGVAVAFARDFALDRRARPFLRLGYGHLSERELAEVARRLARALARR